MLKNTYTKIFLIILVGIVARAKAEVTPPNYDFSLDSLLTPFKPGNPKPKADEKIGNGEKLGNNQLLYYVSHIRYRFPVIVTIKEEKIVDFFARLPAYFLHDIFHQSLINRWGKQDLYLNSEEQSLYIWKNKEGIRYIYSGGCSITCFPIYLTGYLEKPDKPFEPQIKKMLGSRLGSRALN